MTRRTLLIFAALLPLAALSAPPARAEPAERMRMAVTTSFANSGLAEVLLPALEADTGVAVDLLVVGSGQALRLARAGDVDAVLTHAPEAERRFVAEGWARARVPVMRNDFVVIGPAGDPAGAGGAATAPEALARIAAARAPFVSRGDDSGTHMAERALWAAAGLSPEGAWYRPVGAGMGAALNVAAGMGAYALSDRASWLAFGNRAGLSVAFEGDPRLENPYSFLAVDPARHPHVRAQAAARVGAWLTSPRGRAAIAGHRAGGQAAFAPAPP